MTQSEVVPLPEAGTGERTQRRRAQRRRAREQLVTALVLLAALALTVGVLLSKWMTGDAGPAGVTGQSLPVSPALRAVSGAAR